MVVLGIGDGAFQHLLDLAGDALVAEFEIGQSLLDLLAADQLRQQIELLRADAQHAQHSLGLVVLERALGFWLAHLTSSWPSCRPRDRNRYGSVRTRQTCDRSCLRSPEPGHACGRYERRTSRRRIAAGRSSGGSRS